MFKATWMDEDGTVSYTETEHPPLDGEIEHFDKVTPTFRQVVAVVEIPAEDNAEELNELATAGVPEGSPEITPVDPVVEAQPTIEPAPAPAPVAPQGQSAAPVASFPWSGATLTPEQQSALSGSTPPPAPEPQNPVQQ